MSHSAFSGAIVRPATSRDVTALDALIKTVWEDPATDLQCFAGEHRLTLNDLPAILKDAHNVTLVHESGDESGFGLTGVIFLTRVAPTIYDLGIIATPPGAGAGTRLLDAAIDLSRRDRTTTEIYLDVFARNPAVHLYERKGFLDYDRVSSTNQRAEELELRRMRLILRAYDPTAASDLSDSNKVALGAGLKALLRRVIAVIRKFAATKFFL